MAIRRARSSKKLTAPLRGEALVDDFMSAMTNLTTAKTARFMAEQTEHEALQTINYVGTGQTAGYGLSGTIPPELQEAMIRSSLDAHVKKAQAERINDLTLEQLVTTEQADRQKYIGKKIKITIIDSKFQPVETYWWNKNTGEYSQGTVKFKTVKGIIESISLEQNRLVVKPTWLSRLIIPQRKFLVVYIINPDNLQAAVQLELRSL